MRKMMLAIWAAATVSVPLAADPAESESAVFSAENGATPIRPFDGINLTDPHISRIGDHWYLTGTVPDAAEMQIPLWSSPDLKNWTALGNIWDNSIKAAHWSDNGWASPGSTHSNKAKTAVAPEIHQIGDSLYLAYSYSFGGIHLLKSKSGMPAGPWQHHATLTEFGQHPSLFADDDGQVWLVFDGGTVARLNSNLKKIEGKIERIVPAHDVPAKGWGLPPVLDRIGTRGGQIFKRDGVYHFVAADWHERLGTKTDDLFISKSRAGPAGPYTRRYLAVPHGGAGQILQNGAGALIAAERADGYALAAAQPALITLETNDEKQFRPDGHNILESGPAARVKPLLGEWIRDPSVTLGGDGYYYLVGTKGWGWQLPKGGIEMWRSKDLEKWEYRGFAWKFDQADLGIELDPATNPKLWAPEIFWSAHDKTFYLTFSIWTGYGRTWLFRSKSGKAEGPYENVRTGPMVPRGIDGFLYEEGADIYMFYGGCNLVLLTADRSAFAKEFGPQLAAGATKMGYEGCSVLKAQGQYWLFGTDWTGSHEGTYDLYYATGRSISGPWSERRFGIPHAGHATVFHGKEGKVWTTLFGSDATASVHMRLGLLPIALDTNGKLQTGE